VYTSLGLVTPVEMAREVGAAASFNCMAEAATAAIDMDESRITSRVRRMFSSLWLVVTVTSFVRMENDSQRVSWVEGLINDLGVISYANAGIASG
jgi:hypothetical protein